MDTLDVSYFQCCRIIFEYWLFGVNWNRGARTSTNSAWNVNTTRWWQVCFSFPSLLARVIGPLQNNVRSILFNCDKCKDIFSLGNYITISIRWISTGFKRRLKFPLPWQMNNPPEKLTIIRRISSLPIAALRLEMRNMQTAMMIQMNAHFGPFNQIFLSNKLSRLRLWTSPA